MEFKGSITFILLVSLPNVLKGRIMSTIQRKKLILLVSEQDLREKEHWNSCQEEVLTQCKIPLLKVVGGKTRSD